MWNGLSRERFAWSMARFRAGGQRRGARLDTCDVDWGASGRHDLHPVVAGRLGGHGAPGRGGSAGHHTDVRGSGPQVGHPQEGAPD